MSAGAKSPVAAASSGDEGAVVAVSGGAPKKGRVLVLEDDPSFCEMIRDYLDANGYSVVAVGNGGDAVREVMANDFAMVLCNFMMPGLPGDMFYRAVEKIRPALCQRFVFMTRHQDDTGTNEFIQSVNGFVLRKPFPLSDLLDSLGSAGVRRRFQKNVFNGSPDVPEVSRLTQPTDGVMSGGAPPGEETATVQMGWAARSLPLPASALPVNSLPASKSKLRPHGIFRGNALLWGLAFLLFLMAGLWNQHSDAQDGLTAATADQLAMQVQWTKVSRNLEKAVALRSKMEAERAHWARLLADRAKPRLSSILRNTAPSVGEKIEIIEISARGETEEAGPEEVRIRGVAHEPQSRLMADRYREAVERAMQRDTNERPLTARFELLEDLPRVLAEQAGSEFVVVISAAPAEPSSVARKEGR